MNQIPSFLPSAAQFRAMRLSGADCVEEAISGLYGVNALIAYIEELDTKGMSRPLRVLADRLDTTAKDVRDRLSKVVTNGGKPIANHTDRRYLDSVNRKYRGLLMSAAEWCHATTDPEAARYLRRLTLKSG